LQNHALLDFTYSCQASPEHFEQCAEFPPLRNRSLGSLTVPLLLTILYAAIFFRGAGRCAVDRMIGKEF
jgi:hypothetical protein